MIEVTRPNRFTGKINKMQINCTQRQYADGMLAYSNGDFIQIAFRFLSPAEREFILSGTTQEEWEAMFPPEDDETE